MTTNQEGFAEKVERLDPWALLNYMEEARIYAQVNIESRRKSIKDEMKHLWNDDKVCVSSSKKYIKQMEREIKIFEERETTLLVLIDKIKMGEFSK